MGSAVDADGTLNITSKTLPAAIKTSVCTRGVAGAAAAPGTCTPGTGLPSSAINVNPQTVIDHASQDRAGARNSARDTAGARREQRSGRPGGPGLVECNAVNEV